MVNRLVSFFTVLLWSGLIFGQYVERDGTKGNEPSSTLSNQEGYLSFGFGFSSPTGDYGDDSFGNYNSGFAKTGYNINLMYGKFLSENLGFILMYTHSSHALDAAVMESYLQQASPFNQWTVTAGRYNTNGYMGGMMTTFPMTNGFLDIRVLFGYAISKMPEITISVADTVKTETITQYSAKDGNIAFDVGIGFRVFLNENLTLNLNVDFYLTEPSFSLAATSSLGGNSSGINSIKMNMLNPSFGIAYRIRN